MPKPIVNPAIELDPDLARHRGRPTWLRSGWKGEGRDEAG